MSKIIHNTKYEIMTPNGFESFKGIRKLTKSSHYIITLSTGKQIKCSDEHPFMNKFGIIHANCLQSGDLLWGVDDDITVVSVESINSDLELFDIIGVSGGNLFNVDGIISHNCDFVSSGNSVVDLSILDWYNETYVRDPIEKRYNNNYWSWEAPDYNRSYVVSADVSRGDGEDYSAFHVIDIETMTQVAEYRGKVETKEFGNLLVQTATEWNDALLIVENSNIGWATIQQIIDREYKNLFYMSDDLKYVDVENQFSNKWNSKDKRATAGFTMSQRTRPLVISKIDLYFQEKGIIIQSKRTINELMTFIWKNGKAQAADGYNDDLTMALGIGLWVRDTALMLRNQGIDLQRQALGGMKKTGFKEGGVYNSRQLPGHSTIGMPSYDPWKQNVRGGQEDLKWLLK